MAATPTNEAEQVERELRAAMRRYTQRAKALEHATLERDQAIRQAIDARLPRAKIVGITQLSPARIDQIRRGERL